MCSSDLQQIGGVSLAPIAGEITYGLERIAMYIQEVENIYDIKWNNDYNYGDIFLLREKQFSAYNLEYANIENLFLQFDAAEKEAINLLENKLVLPAYEECLKASHILNLLEARKVIAVSERANYISRVRNIAKSCCSLYKEIN